MFALRRIPVCPAAAEELPGPNCRLSSSARLFLCGVIALWSLISLIGSTAQGGVAVWLADGTRIEADGIRQESNTGRFVLYIERPGLQLSRTISGHHVERIEVISGRHAECVEGEPDIQPCAARSAEPPQFGLSITEVRPPHAEPGTSAGCATAPPDSAACCLVQPLPLESAVLGVHSDPLAAYAELLGRHFPAGVSPAEVPIVLEMLRDATYADLLCPLPPAEQDRHGKPAAGEMEFRNSDSEVRVPAAAGHLPPFPAAGFNFRISSLHLEAVPVSMSGKNDWDAMAVHLAAWDAYGRPVPLEGTLRLTLWGQRQELLRLYDEQVTAVPGKVEQIASWTQVLPAPPRTGAFRPGVSIPPLAIVVPLPRPLPDHDLRWADLGELHARLLVPGQGVFEATQGSVVLRHLSPVRDRLQIETGSRFFAGESTRDSRRRGPLRFRDFSSLGPNRGVLAVQP